MKIESIMKIFEKGGKIMSIVKYDPIRELRNLQEEMNRLFNMTFFRSFDDELITGAWTPSVDIFENKDQVVIEVELPGMKPEDVQISIENNVLTIQGEKKFEKKEESDNYHRIERRYGSFTRSFTLPPTVNSDDIKAEFDNGLLRVTIAKREEAKPRRIEIKTTSGSASA
jgi:HSP20 family protein